VLEVKEGDLICQFWNMGVVVTLRKRPDKNVYGAGGNVDLNTGNLENDRQAYEEWAIPLAPCQTTLIWMDIGTLSMLVPLFKIGLKYEFSPLSVYLSYQ
jgi:hypothetical protein